LTKTACIHWTQQREKTADNQAGPISFDGGMIALLTRASKHIPIRAPVEKYYRKVSPRLCFLFYLFFFSPKYNQANTTKKEIKESGEICVCRNELEKEIFLITLPLQPLFLFINT
jgi:hypothetical protein